MNPTFSTTPPSPENPKQPERDVMLWTRLKPRIKTRVQFKWKTWCRISRAICCEESMAQWATADFLLATQGVELHGYHAQELAKEASAVLRAFEEAGDVGHQWATSVELFPSHDQEWSDIFLKFKIVDLRDRLNEADIDALRRLRDFLKQAPGFVIERP